MESLDKKLNYICRNMILQLMYHPKSNYTLQDVCKICQMRELELFFFLENEYNLSAEKAFYLGRDSLFPLLFEDDLETCKTFLDLGI